MKKNLVRKLCMIFLGTGLVAVMGYLGLVGAKLVRGVSVTENPPSQVVRLQVVQAGGGEAAIGKTVRRIKDLVGGELEVQVVETGSFDLRAVTRTTVVSRTEGLRGAGMLAERLGLEGDEVWYQPMEHNTRQVTATLIVGPDIDRLLSVQETKKELQKQS